MNGSSLHPLGTLQLRLIQLVPSGAHSELAADVKEIPAKKQSKHFQTNLEMPCHGRCCSMPGRPV